MDIQPIETRYKGRRFRSRLEARWWIFFEEMKIPMQYELEEFVFNGMPYLPNFHCEKYKFWVEIKPLSVEMEAARRKCSLLATLSNQRVILITGEPSLGGYSIQLFPDEIGTFGNAYFASDRRDDFYLWLQDKYSDAAGAFTAPTVADYRDHDRWPVESEALLNAYDKATSERF